MVNGNVLDCYLLGTLCVFFYLIVVFSMVKKFNRKGQNKLANQLN